MVTHGSRDSGEGNISDIKGKLYRTESLPQKQSLVKSYETDAGNYKDPQKYSDRVCPLTRRRSIHCQVKSKTTQVQFGVSPLKLIKHVEVVNNGVVKDSTKRKGVKSEIKREFLSDKDIKISKPPKHPNHHTKSQSGLDVNKTRLSLKYSSLPRNISNFQHKLKPDEKNGDKDTLFQHEKNILSRSISDLSKNVKGNSFLSSKQQSKHKIVDNVEEANHNPMKNLLSRSFSDLSKTVRSQQFPSLSKTFNGSLRIPSYFTRDKEKEEKENYRPELDAEMEESEKSESDWEVDLVKNNDDLYQPKEVHNSILKRPGKKRCSIKHVEFLDNHSLRSVNMAPELDVRSY